MSKNMQKGWKTALLNEKSSRTLIEKAKTEVPNFEQHYKKFEQNAVINNYAPSTIHNYSRAVAKLSLYFKTSILELDPEQVNEFLFDLAQHGKTSETAFKHTVYGLRFFFRLYGLEDRVLKLPNLKHKKSLPTVLSELELKALFKASKFLKHRVMLSLIYSAGLRVSEVVKLKIADIDFDRMQIKICNSKNRKDRYVILGDKMAVGLKKYIDSAYPKDYLFNGREKGSPMSHNNVQRTFREACKKANIIKKVSCHDLRHSYATHLLEQGVDVVTLMKLMGHGDIGSTLVYLHVAKITHKNAHSPFDTLYQKR